MFNGFALPFTTLQLLKPRKHIWLVVTLGEHLIHCQTLQFKKWLLSLTSFQCQTTSLNSLFIESGSSSANYFSWKWCRVEKEKWKNKAHSTSSPCFRTSSTAEMSSSLRSWLSLAICSPFSKKFCVACSTDTARTWAFLERPFFLLDGPLLLVFTSVVTWGERGELAAGRKSNIYTWNIGARVEKTHLENSLQCSMSQQVSLVKFLFFSILNCPCESFQVPIRASITTNLKWLQWIHFQDQQLESRNHG